MDCVKAIHQRSFTSTVYFRALCQMANNDLCNSFIGFVLFEMLDLVLNCLYYTLYCAWNSFIIFCDCILIHLSIQDVCRHPQKDAKQGPNI